jgi:hypothetical protein
LDSFAFVIGVAALVIGYSGGFDISLLSVLKQISADAIKPFFTDFNFYAQVSFAK